ncbi:MAG TPA: lipopolysaccharide biosynthesis protein [Candidatus Paceibacterota bacterium]|nr:lipopolysaccharide biosynthesis protein [Candidatus Paceibacterota bacterium]
MTGYAQRLWNHFLTDTLFRNSIYLMLSTGFMGAFGFFFWLICAHLFTSDQIGIGTALISAMALISAISTLGFNSTFIRVLPTSTNRNDEINTGSILVVAASAIIATAYVFGVSFIAPKLGIIHQNFWYAAGFVITVALASINSLSDSVFIAYRAAHYALITDGLVTSIAKLLLPLVFVVLGAYGVFAAASFAASIGMVASIFYMVRKFNYHPRFTVSVPVIKQVFHYSFTNYIADLFNMVPTLVLPIIVLDVLGAAPTGYFFLAFMIVNLIYAVPAAVSGSLFAEGSYGVTALRTLLKRSAVLLTAIMVPAAILFAAIGPFVLGFFGKEYSTGGAGVIIVLALSAPAVACFDIGSSLLRITKQVYSLVVVNIFYAAVVCACALLWASRGIDWVAAAWLAGNVVAAIMAFLFVFQGHQRHLRMQAAK